MSLTPHGPGFSFVDSFEIIEPRKRGCGRKWLNYYVETVSGAVMRIRTGAFK